ncbi:MAG: pilus assembly PilX N-terminal domain-containing protein [Actinomycetota bacterium]
MMKRTLHGDERGIALVTVIIISVILMTLVAASTGFALTSLNSSRRDQDWNAALPAAEAGIDDYLYRLSRDSSYWQYDATTLPPDGNLAFTQWVKVPGAANSYFRYFIDSSLISTQGIVKIRSSGRVNGVVRTVEALFRRRNFLDFLYFTEYETTDPASYTGSPFTPLQAQANCARHYYDSPSRSSSCSDIYFIGIDTIKGPLHSNDAIAIGTGTSPNFQGETSTSWDGTCPSGASYCSPSTNRYRGSATPIFARAGDPALAPPLTMPPTNLALRNYSDSAVGGTGCLFTGPTKIVFNSNGTMTVTSPYTKVSNCQVGAGPLPSNGVIYVQSVPTSPSNPNYRASCSVSSGNPLGYPFSGDINSGQYGCFDGDVFVSGTLDGQVTVAAQDSVIITGNTTYQGGTAGNDILGLIADNYVEVYHPVNSSGSNLSGSLTSPTIHAAILSIKHSFRVQSHNRGNPLGTLTIFGAIAQLYRGPVGTFSGSSISTGYGKDYTYDQKLKYTSPPYFLDPVASAWGIKTWAECKPADPPGATSCT